MDAVLRVARPGAGAARPDCKTIGGTVMKFLRGTAVASASFIVATVGCVVSQPVDSQPAPAQEQLVDATGNMHIPKNYQTTYEFFGSWSIAGDKGAKEIHVVYASPGTAAAYRATGEFPHGSILVKEVYGTGTSSMTTGTVSHQEILKGW